MASNGISIKELGQAQDHNSLESNATKCTAIKETLGSNGNVTNLPHLVATVGHLLICQVGHLDTKLLDQLEVDVGAVGCRQAGRLQDREGSALHNKNVFLNTSSIFQS